MPDGLTTEMLERMHRQLKRSDVLAKLPTRNVQQLDISTTYQTSCARGDTICPRPRQVLP